MTTTTRVTTRRRTTREDDEPALVVLGHDLNDPGNAGTLIRTADAAGATQVILTGRSVDPTNPKAVRAAAGALFHLPVRTEADLDAVLADLGARGVQRLATVVDGGVPYDEVDLTGPTALVLGSEAHGLPEWVGAVVDQPVTIPMRGRAESLNVAMAGAVLCFEAERQRRVRRRRRAPGLGAMSSAPTGWTAAPARRQGSTTMIDEIQRLETDGVARIGAAATLDDLVAVDRDVLGKKSGAQRAQARARRTERGRAPHRRRRAQRRAGGAAAPRWRPSATS